MQRDTQSVLTFENVSKAYGDFRAVEQLSFTVGRGQIYGFLGPNGAGKTTSLRMLLGLIAPSAGRINVLGADSVMGVRSRVGYLPEERGLYKRMTPVETIVYLASLKGMAPAPARARAMELLEAFGLKAFAHARIEALSKGMAQKVQILSTVVHGPDLVILDEPFSGLDPVNQQVLEELIEAMRREGKTVLFSTHVMQHAERLCDRLLLIAKGRRIFEGTVSEALAQLPRRLRVRTQTHAQALSSLPGIASVTPDDGPPGGYELTLHDGARPEDVMRAFFAAQIELESFDLRPPQLHDVFVALVGQEARIADARASEGARA